ncbi:uncharacterized protein LOC129592573 isoform X2 [Paramacrobiotus metropolitanus]|uniref:uncharacterized protein LOC129592573 isoform X2 n=1 Tax=Paramacrobiotus metropolitanus TaxID=2943436 RepID=UPI002445FFD8|nr:uncharacterized protein LOC129592573 isoform X2 [Paramacrobiotus metropolitanus]
MQQLSFLMGIKALQCQLCSFPENSFPEWCTTMKNTSTMTCDPAAGATTCYIATGIRPLEGSKPPVFAPAVTRHCSVFTKLDTELWKTMAKGQKMVCIELVQTKLPPGPNGMPMIDRRCICAEDNCNKLGWDEVMQQPALPKNYTASDTPQPSQFADYSLAVLHGMLKTNGSNGDNLSDTSHTTTAKSNDTATDASTMAGNSVKDAGGSGSSAGLIAGISIGLVALAAAAGGLFYWFKMRKRKPSISSGTTGTSDNSNDTGESADDD